MAATKRPPIQLSDQVRELFSPRSLRWWHAATYTHPDASDARRAGGPVLARQSLLALLTMLTIRPWVPLVPLGGEGTRRREREGTN